MTRVPIEEKKRIAEMLSHPDRPLQIMQNHQFPGMATRRRRREVAELNTTTAMESALAFLARLGRAAGLH